MKLNETADPAAATQPVYIEVIFNSPAPGRYTYKLAEGMNLSVGMRVSAPFGRRKMTGYTVSVGVDPGETDFEIKAIERIIDKQPIYGTAEIALARWLADMYYCTEGEALATMLPGGKRESRMPAFEEFELPPVQEITLSDEQRRAIDGIMADDGGVHYLYGITGSGKTEVFLRTAAAVIESGGGVIYLVPEISLTHQLTDEVRMRFGKGVAVLHSALTPSQKLVEWQRIRSGEARFVIGARSAVFAPVPDLGLIIIDEEHESAYKSGSKPRYHARQVAMHRAGETGARMIMGSATPSLEAWYLVKSGRIKGETLGKRLSGGAVPDIELIDMKKYKGCISKPLETAIRETAAEGRQTILFLNRRGFSYFFHCRSCGYESRCRNCSVSLTYHKHRNKLICHYCGYSEEPKQVCPECGSLDVGYSGFGTELIESELNNLFPDLRIERVDTDSVKQKGSLRDRLDRFKAGEIDLLLGTQMVAKGLNFPGVKLVGIVLADTSLHLPDFRAHERTFNLIVQVAGRAGRFFPDGRVMIQTYKPDNEAVKMAAGGTIDAFYEREIEIRRALEFPPFGRLFRLVFRGKNAERTASAAENFAARFDTEILPKESGTEVLGPAECPLSMISGNYRFQIIIRTDNFRLVHSLFRGALSQFTPPSGVYLEADVDPVNLL
ncbi:MAG: primosomal protein N' [Spirochaetales bacterium]|uniref:Replication restart protein PriA n=1 Tax=Candidatus Thalassospirochaeta sargassi TaxID=3119039 RepID=A0AAJ1IG61_9SPIO|nr:primosomal protein N' [Spirochaetales bacterium]